MWHLLTDAAERQRIESTATCLRTCEVKYHEDFVGATFCVLESCGQAILDCNQDSTCREALHCLPKTMEQCALPQLQSYVQQELFKNTTKCVGRGLELCGAATVELVRNQDVAEAVRCASQCTIPPAMALV